MLLEKKYDYADYIEIDKTAKELGIILEFIEKINNYNQKVNIAGFIGDVHAEDALFESSIAFFKHHGMKNIYCLGDFCDGYGNVDKIISIVKDEGIISVQGNHDVWCLEGIMHDHPSATHLSQLSQRTVDYLKRLPKTYRIITYAGEILLCHGILDNEMAKINPDDYGYAIESNTDLQTFITGPYPAIMINGHSHRRMVKQIQGKTIINVGTLYREHNPCITIVDFVNKNVYFYDIIDGVVKDDPKVVNLNLK